MINGSDPNGYPECAAVAQATILAVMAEGAEKHEPGQWKREGVSHHMAHAASHLVTFQRTRSDEDLQHCLVRLAMAVWCRNNGIDGTPLRDGSDICDIADAECSISSNVTCPGCGGEFCITHLAPEAHACEAGSSDT